VLISFKINIIIEGEFSVLDTLNINNVTNSDLDHIEVFGKLNIGDNGIINSSN